MSELQNHLSMFVLAVVQGVTEFLPVSSSGHLALGQMILRVGEGSLVEDVVLHAGTLVAVLVFYRRDLVELVLGLWRQGAVDGIGSRRYVALLLLGNVPAGVIGLTLKDRIEVLFDSPVAVLVALGATAVMLAFTRRLQRRNAPVDAWRAVAIGCAQALAILPGASRSGWTIAMALALGLSPVAAARFSFLLSIPAIAGATVLQLSDVENVASPASSLALGFVVAAITGLFSLRWLVVLVRRMELYRFAWYLAAVVTVGAVFLLVRGGA
ncbi:MAG TPA: undecaprenyl-diphosphate phosphatase [Candidatus Krumholzibacteria bacterium]|nr:undecaprenyl-diphosphate phosphatase [Candidatus Krumholzibacteria bacterium]